MKTDDRVIERIAFVSCIRQNTPQPGWDSIRAADPDLLLLLGDNMYFFYHQGPDHLRQGWDALARQEGFRRLIAQVPMLATWDDHDYGVNDGGREFADKEVSRMAFLDFLGAPADDPRRTQDGIWHARVFGPPDRRVQVIVLDTRWNRSPLRPHPEGHGPGRGPWLPEYADTAEMLGETQWTWLKQELQRPAQVRILASSLQVLPPGIGWEGWSRMPLQRQKLLNLLAKASGAVVILSGGRHFGEAMRDPANGLVEVTASGLNKAMSGPWEEPDTVRLGELLLADNFGLVEIDWVSRRVRTLVQSLDGAQVREVVRPIP